MPAYLSDRQRVEQVLLVQMLWAVVEAGAPDSDEKERCKALLKAALNEPVADLDDRKRGKIAARAGRAHLDVTEPYRREGDRCDKVALIVFFLIKSVTECDYMVIGPGSDIDRALDLFLPAIAHMTEEPRLYAAGRKQARKVLDHLQRIGYFGGVPFADDPAEAA